MRPEFYVPKLNPIIVILSLEAKNTKKPNFTRRSKFRKNKLEKVCKKIAKKKR